MKLRVVVRPQARTELREAQAWYENKVAGLGADFARAIDLTLTAVEHHPEAFPKVHGEMRQCVMRRFPYSVVYRLTENAIVILAVHHHRRDPERWRNHAG